MRKITAILVDDEKDALSGLEQKLATHFAHIDIVGIFQNPEEALGFIEKNPPDILFLDIEMPRMNGFELLSKLNYLNFQVIFVTAYSEYAIKAFRASAIGYVVKPVDNEEFMNTVKKALSLIEQNRQTENNIKLVEILSEALSLTNKIVIPTGKGLSFIPQEQVVNFEGYSGYTNIYLDDGSKIMSSYNIGRFEQVLNRVFFKCHKSHIINLAKVRSLENEGYIVLENGCRIPISKSNKKAFLQLFR